MTDIPATQSHLLMPSLTDTPAATYVNGEFVGVQLDSRAQWNVRTDEARYWLELSRVAGEVGARLAATELKTPDDWCEELGARVVDPDGWRGPNGRDWTDPISREEFDRRLRICTIDGRGYPSFYGRAS